MKKVVLITGGSGTIGMAISKKYQSNNYHVAMTYLTRPPQVSNNILTLRCDGKDSKNVKECVDTVMEKYNRVDVLINLAGTAIDKLLIHMSDEEWDTVIKTNLYGTFYFTRDVAKIMIKQKSGHILTISSFTAYEGTAGCINYTSSKGALISFTKSAARELGKFNICVNCILPGFHISALTKNIWEKSHSGIFKRQLLNKTTDLNELVDFVFNLTNQNSVSGQIFNFDNRIISAI